MSKPLTDTMSYERAIKILKARSKHIAEINIDAQVAYKLAIEALEKQMFDAKISLLDKPEK